MKDLFKALNESYNRLAENVDERFEMISTKSVTDTDGFKTDYTLWYDGDEDNYFTIFGDRDIYDPRMSSHDMDFGENLEEAENWFYEYEGFEDELDECLNEDSLDDNGAFWSAIDSLSEKYSKVKFKFRGVDKYLLGKDLTHYFDEDDELKCIFINSKTILVLDRRDRLQKIK